MRHDQLQRRRHARDIFDHAQLSHRHPGAPVGINWLDASGPPDNSISFDFGTIDSANGLSQFASDCNVAVVIQNGAEVGELNGVTIDDEGFIIAAFANGATQKIYKAADRDLRQAAGS